MASYIKIPSLWALETASIKAWIEGQGYTVAHIQAASKSVHVDMNESLTNAQIALMRHKAKRELQPQCELGNDGVAVRDSVLHSGNGIVDLEQTLTAGRSELDGVPTKIGFFNPESLTDCFGILSIDVKTVGTGAKLWVVEVDGVTRTDLNSTPISIPDTAGAWQLLEAQTDVTPSSLTQKMFYALDQDLGAATSGSVRRGMLSLLELV